VATLRQIISKFSEQDLRELLTKYKVKDPSGKKPEVINKLLTYYGGMAPDKAIKEVDRMFGQKPSDLVKLVDSKVRPRARPSSGTDKPSANKPVVPRPRRRPVPRPVARPDSNTNKPSVTLPRPRPNGSTERNVPRPIARPNSGTDKRPPAKLRVNESKPKTKTPTTSRRRNSESIADKMTARMLELQKQGKSNKEATEILKKERAAGKFSRG
jgi:hypothetical protein